MIANQYLAVVGHPNDEYLGRPLYSIGPDYRMVYDLLIAKRPVSSMRITDADGTQAVASFRRMFNGWFVGVVIPLGSYYRDVYYTAAILSSLGAVMILMLCLLLLRLSAARIRSDEANKSKSSFLATMSHEIRTPLNAIMGLSEIQLQKSLPEDAHADLEKIYSSGSSLLAIINDILDISKIEVGGIELASADYDIAELIDNTVQLNIVRVGSKRIAFSLSVDETIPSRLRGDGLRLKQILSNLLSNAFKYTEEGKVTLQATWKRQGENAVLTFTVADTGTGIKKDDLGKLFKEYSQLNSRADRNIEGTGLGLSITKRLLELMGGTIVVESEYGVGSVFRVEITQRIASDVPIGAQKADDLRHFRFMENHSRRGKNLVRTYMPYGRVLIVDDVTTNLDVAKGLMIPYGLRVDYASSGREAIEKIRSISDETPDRERYDAVFMDHMMPEMDGVEATRIIRNDIGTEYAASVPIIALTANAIRGNEEMFMANGCNAFISKPIDIAQLDAVLNKWVRDRQSAETLMSVALEKNRNLAGKKEPPAAAFALRLEGVDLASGVQRYEGKDEYLQILRSYALHTAELLDRLRNPAGDLKDYTVAVHGLKGASYGICADKVGDMAGYLENAAKRGDFEAVREKNGSLIEMTESLISDLKNLLTAEGDRQPENAGRGRQPEPDVALLEKMLAAATRCRTSEMEAVLSELELYEYESGGDIVLWMREQMDNLDYTAISERLDEMRRENQGGRSSPGRPDCPLNPK
jgi:signal transduction histidine kinase/DNA-binding response OmpR family regulator